MDRHLRDRRDTARAPRSPTRVTAQGGLAEAAVLSACSDVMVTNARPRSLGERYGWLYGSLWLVFLGFPLYYLVTGDDTTTVKTVGVAMITVFAALYVIGNRYMHTASETTVWRYLTLLAVIVVAMIPIFGVNVFAFTPFLCAFAMMALPLRNGLMVSVPLIALSVIVALTVDPAVFEFTLINLGVSVATAAVGIFMRSGQQVEELRLRATLASDQERIARDVHDVLGHSLTAVVVKAELAQRLVTVDPDAALRELNEIETLSRRALAEIRATVGGLRATRLIDEVETARQLLTASGIEVEVPGDANAVDPSASVALAWAVRESATNIVRHSGARSATIRWGRNWVEVSDDGCGFDADVVTADGINKRRGTGLAGLRERVLAMGGSITIENGADGRGTVVRVDAMPVGQ